LKVLIIYNLPSNNKNPDDLDVLVQLDAVSKSLKELGHEVYKLGITLDLETFENKLLSLKPDLVFNLVEAINGVEKYMHFVPSILEFHRIPFTGANSNNLFITTDKIECKKKFRTNGIPTPNWINGSLSTPDNLKFPVIVKPIISDASLGINDEAIAKNKEELQHVFVSQNRKYGHCFIEEYIDGREFNVSVIGTKKVPKIFPIAEIIFENYPKEKARIISYDAKWNSDTFEYKNTNRNFEFPSGDNALIEKLKVLSAKCWKNLELEGYARVDFRVDRSNKIYVLEINSNPCISPDSGFVAAAHESGLDYTQLLKEIIYSK